MSSCCVLLSIEDFQVNRGRSAQKMASIGTPSGDTTSSDGCPTPNSNPNYDSDVPSGEDSHANLVYQSVAYHQCGVCKQPYCDPRVLDCLHAYCLFCLRSMMVRSPDRPVEVVCITCKARTKLETGNLNNDTIVDFGRRRCIENMTFNEDDNLLCRSCKQGNPAVTRCYECAMFLCNMCTPQHGKLHCYADHHVISLHDTFNRPANEIRFCHAHPEAGHPPTLYCYYCRMSFCEASQHQIQNPTHKVVTIADSNSFQEMIISINIEKEKAHKAMMEYDTGVKTLSLCQRKFKEDLNTAKANLLHLVNMRFQDLEQAVTQYATTTQTTARNLVRCYHSFFQQLDTLCMFMDAQTKNAQPWDNLLTRPFVEKMLKKINNSKPEPRQNLHFELEFAAGNHEEAAVNLGYINVTRTSVVDQQVTGHQQQPIARPTTMIRSTNNQNFNAVNGYQNADTLNGPNNFSQYNAFNGQPQAYRTNVGSQSTEANQIGYFGYEQRSQQRNGYEQFPTQNTYSHPSSSPMNVSQPNSATMVNDSVFDFNLQLDRADGTNGNYPVGYPTQNQNRPYQAWSNGIDQPVTGGSPAPIDDIFTRSTLFQVPDGQGSNPNRSYSPIKRTRMQFISKFGEYGNSQGQFTEPSGVAIDSENRLIVADTNNSRIQVFNIHGGFISQFGSSVNSRLTYPNRIAVSKVTGKVVITERAPSHRVQTYTIEGRHLKTFGEDILQHPRGVAVDKDDNIIIIECKVMRVTIFSMEGQLLDQFSLSKDLQFPNSVAVNNRQEIFISDNRSHNVKVFSYKGELLRTIGHEGLTNYPIAVAINQRDQVVVADNHNNFNITVFEQDGTLVGGYESKTKHAQCFDLTVTDDGLAILTSKDFKVYCYPYQDDSPHHPQNQRR